VYTRCTGCHTAHAVNASLLARAGGKYRCGKCNKVCSALDALFDEWPEGSAQPPPPGDLPVLGLTIDLEQARKSRQEPDEAALTGELNTELDQGGNTGGWLTRFAWIALAVVISLTIIVQYVAFQEKSLSDLPLLNSTLVRIGVLEPPVKTVFRDLDQVHLVSRELKSHPFKADTLQLTATIVNRARQMQPYPELDVILLDSEGETVSQVRFSPADYLADGTSTDSGMTPEAYLPLVLELRDPGNQAVGFELNFE